MTTPFRYVIASGLLLVAASTGHAQFLGKSLNEWSAELRSGDETQRRNAAFALGKLDKHGLPAIGPLKLAATDKSAKVREAAIFALGEIGMKSTGAGRDVELQTVLVAALKDQEPLVRRSAAFALGCLSADAMTARKDVEALLTDNHADVRQGAAWALGRLGDDGIPALASVLKDPDPLVLRDAAQSIGLLDPKSARVAVADLARLATNPDVEVKKAALFALVAIVKPTDRDSPTVVSPLQKSLVDGDEEVRRNGAFALSNIGGSAAAPALDVLTDALKNGEIDIKRQAAAAFGNIGPAAKSAVPELVNCMKTADDEELKVNAIQALGGIGKSAEAAVPPLVDIVGDRNDKVESRSKAAVSLSKIGDVKAAVAAAPKLLDVVSDPHEDGKVRERVMWALRVHNVGLRDMRGVQDAFRKVLVEPAADKNRMVRQDCAYLTSMVWGEKAPPEVFPVLLDYLKDESLQIYQGVAVAVSSASPEAQVGKASSRELGEGDGRKLALDALHAIGPNVVNTHPEIVAQIRRLAESDRSVASFKTQCKKYLETLK